MMTPRWLTPTVLLMALALTGCPDRFARPEAFVAEPAPLLAAIEQRAAAIQSLRGQLRLEVWRKDERVRLRQLVAVQTPDKLRIDSLSPFDQPLSTLVSDGDTLSIYDLGARRFLRGAASPANLARLIPIPLEPEALSALLRGSVPVLREPDEQTVSWDSNNGWYQLDQRRGEARTRISFEPKHLRVVALRLGQGDRTVLRARLGDYSGTGPTAMPRRMRFEAPADDVRIDLKVVDHDINPTLPAAAFVLNPPRGIRVETLD